MAVIKGISNFGTPYYTDEPRYERKNGQWIDTKAGIIDELEKIKTEIHKQSLGEWYVGRLDGKSENVTTIKSIDRIIDKHISELKGENK